MIDDIDSAAASFPRGEQHHLYDIRVAGQKLGPKARSQARLEFSGRGRVGPAGPIYLAPRVRRVDLAREARETPRRVRAPAFKSACYVLHVPQNVVELLLSRADSSADRSQ